ncbi:MAG: DNA-3-methyladenine glycosylase I [Pseudomonadota bacterium]
MSLRSIEELYEVAASTKGGAAEFEKTLGKPRSVEELSKVGDDRWLSSMSKAVFQAGFNWKVVEKKWPRFEEVFDGFTVGRMALISDDDFDTYLKTEGIIRHAKKILSIRDNAIFLNDLAKQNGSGGQTIAKWPKEDFSGLLWMMKKQGSRLGGATAQYFLRDMGVDGYILSRDVNRALIREGVLSKDPSSRRDLEAIQEAFNHWRDQSGRPLMQISRILACSVE